jgi:hypothetical protein
MLLIKRRGGGAVGSKKPVSPIRRSIECVTPVSLFVILVAEEDRKDAIREPGELELAPWTTRLTRGSTTVLSQAVPEGALQSVAKGSASILYSINRRPWAPEAHKSELKANASATRSFLGILVRPP